MIFLNTISWVRFVAVTIVPFLVTTLVGTTSDGLKSLQRGESKIYFEDVTEQSGLKIEHIASAEKRYLIETMGGGVAFLDYDRDGWLDAYLTNTPTVQSFKSGHLPANRLYRNNHDGTFSDVSEKAGVAFRGWSFGVSVADYNDDGFADIYLTNFGPNVLYRNNGDGTFTDVT